MTHTGPLIELRSIRKKLGGRDVLCGVDLALSAPGIRILMGPNGSGKTTLINVVAGILRPDSGSIVLGEHDATALAPFQRRQLGLARSFQSPLIMPTLTVGEHLVLAAGHRRRLGSTFWHLRSRSAPEELDASALWLVGQQPSSPSSQLSHTHLKLLDTAMACVGHPTVVLLDEPTAGLSGDATANLLTTIKNLARSAAVLVVEHNLEFIAQLGGEVSFLFEGRLAVTGTLEEVQRSNLARSVYFHSVLRDHASA